jgi:hypothetical protein
VFGLHFGELFIIGFVLITVVGAPYAGRLGERIAVLLHLGGAEVEPEDEPEVTVGAESLDDLMDLDEPTAEERGD